MPRKTLLDGQQHKEAPRASMRPRPDAAENRRRRRRIWCSSRRCFNEAAARCRGKPRAGAPRVRAGARASMRPRPDAAENHTLMQLLTRYVHVLQ